METTSEPQQTFNTFAQKKNESYDIIEEKKKTISQKKQDEKDFSQISKNIISNKNRKLLRNIEHGKKQKQDAV